MAKLIDIVKDKQELLVNIQKAVGSASLNFLIGSGCSSPALKVLGNIEKDIHDKIAANKQEEAEKLMFDFIGPFLDSTNALLENTKDEATTTTIENYQQFITVISKILYERKSNILHKQATVFTTNYDLFIEKASDQFETALILNDGFKRTPSLSNSFKFSIGEFFNTVCNTGSLYNYQVQVPMINLIKLHGSLNWGIENGSIINSLECIKKANELRSTDEECNVAEFNDLFSIILPKKEKFKETILNQIYYDLLRIYANELDKENTLLIAEGFSFADEHILEITKRALKNPTLKLIIFCFRKDDMTSYENIFQENNNVDIVLSEKDTIGFKEFGAFLMGILSEKKEPPVYKVELKESNDE